MKQMPKLLVTLLFLSSIANAERILIVGDSLSCRGFGSEIVSDLTNMGNEVTLYCSVSANPDHWMYGIAPWRPEKHPDALCEMRKSGSPAKFACDLPGNPEIPKFTDMLKKHPADRVIVALGTNSLPGKPDSYATLKDYRTGKVTHGDQAYEEMISAIKKSGAKCDWIGPPHLQPEKAIHQAAKDDLAKKDDSLPSFYTALNQKISGRCGVIDSLEATKKGTPGNQTAEGIHQTDGPPYYASKYRYEHMKDSIHAELGQTKGAFTNAPDLSTGRAN